MNRPGQTILRVGAIALALGMFVWFVTRAIRNAVETSSDQPIVTPVAGPDGPVSITVDLTKPAFPTNALPVAPKITVPVPIPIQREFIPNRAVMPGSKSAPVFSDAGRELPPPVTPSPSTNYIPISPVPTP